MPKKPPSKIGECCDLMKLVLSRELPKRRPQLGLELAPFVSFKKGAEAGVSVVLHFPRSKTRTERFADCTYAELNFCPWCGAPIKRKEKKRARQQEPAGDPKLG